MTNPQPPPAAERPAQATESSQPPASPPDRYPFPASPAQKMRPTHRLLIAVGALLAAVLAAGTGFAAVLVLRDQHSSAPEARTQASPTPRDLAASLLPVPDGATAWPGKPLTQPIDLDQVDDLAAGQDDWRQELDNNGLIDGVVRRWMGRDGQLVEVALLRIADDDMSAWKVYESVVNYCTTGDVWESEGQKVGELFVTRYRDAQGNHVQMGVNYAGDVLIKILVGGTAAVDKAGADQMLQDQSAALR